MSKTIRFDPNRSRWDNYKAQRQAKKQTKNRRRRRQAKAA